MTDPEQQDFVEDFEMTSDQADLPEVRLSYPIARAMEQISGN